MFSIKKIKNFRPLKLRKKLLTRRPNLKAVDAAFLGIMLFAFISLIALIYFQVRPLKLVDIKVPVATEKAWYTPGERVNGIFFGEIFYTGRVQVYTDIFCAGYRAPIRGDDGATVFSGNSRPVVLKGDTRFIGTIPEDAPVGKNCVIQFVNSYDIKTPFGNRHEERAYYTQNFFIRDPNDREEDNAEPESSRGTDASGERGTTELFSPEQSQPAPDDENFNEQTQTQPNRSQTSPPNQSQNTNDTPVTPAEPVEPPQQRCVIDLFGIRLICS